MEYLSSVTRFAYHNLCAPVSLGDAKLFEKVQSVACKVFQKIKDFFQSLWTYFVSNTTLPLGSPSSIISTNSINSTNTSRGTTPEINLSSKTYTPIFVEELNGSIKPPIRPGTPPLSPWQILSLTDEQKICIEAYVSAKTQVKTGFSSRNLEESIKEIDPIAFLIHVGTTPDLKQKMESSTAKFSKLFTQLSKQLSDSQRTKALDILKLGIAFPSIETNTLTSLINANQAEELFTLLIKTGNG